MEKVELMRCEVPKPLKINKVALFEILQRDESVPSHEIFLEIEWAERDEKGCFVVKDGKVVTRIIGGQDGVIQRFKLAVGKPDS